MVRLTWAPDFVDPAMRLALLERAVENLPMGVTVLRFDGRPVFGNRRFRELSGFTDEFERGMTFAEMVAEGRFSDWKEDPVEFFNRITEAAVEGRSVTAELKIGDRVISIHDVPLASEYILSSQEDVTERVIAEGRLAHLALHDSLTGLPNRAAFSIELDKVLAEAEAKAEKFAIISIDLDRFKDINDVFGHGTGDALLQEVAGRLRSASEGHFVARLGGDEFFLICSGGAQPDAAGALAENVLALVAGDMVINGRPMLIGLSMGVAVYPSDGANVASLMNHADAALYRSKGDGRGTLRFYQPSMDEQIHEHRLLQQDLHHALARDELRLCYQPQATVEGEVTGFEALLRWELPRLGTVMPGDFIPIAEKSGLIVEIGEWILREACREAASWRRPLQISVNISPVQFRHGDLAALIHEILLKSGLKPERLEIEITEGVLVDDFGRAIALLRRIKNLGVRVAMDDFGTGYSSLSYLQAFPFDKLKVDRSFIAKLGSNQHAREIIRAIIGLGRGLNLPVVAEGVETQEQIAFLSDEHCYGMQGFFVGKPKPIGNYAELVGSCGKETGPATNKNVA